MVKGSQAGRVLRGNQGDRQFGVIRLAEAVRGDQTGRGG